MPTVYAAFDSHQALIMAVEQLQRFGFSRASIRHDGDDHFQVPSSAVKQSVGVLSTVESFFAKLANPATALPAGLYEETLRRGGSVLAVDAASAVEERTARELVRNSGCIDVERYSEAHASLVSEKPGYAAAAASEVEPGDRAVVVGGLPVKMYSTAGGALASEADFKCFEPGDYEIRQQVEVITLTKTARVVEELSVHKLVTVYTETIEDTLRSTVVESERLAASSSPLESSCGTSPNGSR